MKLASILTIIFVIAKLTGVINWSWWIVFAPALVSVTIQLLCILFVLVVGVIAVYFGGK